MTRSSRLTFVLVAVLSLSGGVALASADARYRELVMVVDRNTGWRYVRGVDRHTIEALRKAVTEDDIPIMQKMLSDSDKVVAIAAERVLMLMGARGRRAVYETILTAPDEKTRTFVADELAGYVTNYVMKQMMPSWTEDIPLLRKIAESQEYGAIRAAGRVLKQMGEPGTKAIADIAATTSNEKTRRVLIQILESPY